MRRCCGRSGRLAEHEKETEAMAFEYDHEEFMRAATVAHLAVRLARLNGHTEAEAEVGQAWDLIDGAIELRREVLASDIPLK